MSENAAAEAAAAVPMDDAAILAELSSDAPTTTDAQADSETIEAAEADGGNIEGNAGDGEGEGAGQQAEPALNLAKLQALAEERRARRPEPKQEQAEEKPAERGLVEALTEAMRGTKATEDRWAEAVKAYKSGDMIALSRAFDGEGADAAAAFEKLASGSLDPDGTRTRDALAKLQAEVAELRAERGKLPENVLTSEKLEEMRQKEAMAKATAESEAAFTELVSGESESHPFLSAVDKNVALRYAWQANDLLLDHAKSNKDFTFTLADVSRVAEEIASSELRGLIARNEGAASESKGGRDTEKAASAATAGETKARGGIDNRAASTTAATMPDPDDDDAYEQRLIALARAT